MFWRDGVVDFVIPEEVVRRLDEQELQDAFHNDLSEDPTPIVDRDLRTRLVMRIAVVRCKRRRDDGLPVFCVPKISSGFCS